MKHSASHRTTISFSSETEPEEILDGAESQNYGYGYGTKVRGKGEMVGQ